MNGPRPTGWLATRQRYSAASIGAEIGAGRVKLGLTGPAKKDATRHMRESLARSEERMASRIRVIRYQREEH